MRSTSVYNEDKCVALGWVGPLTGMRRKQSANFSSFPYTNIRERAYESFPGLPLYAMCGPANLVRARHLLRYHK